MTGLRIVAREGNYHITSGPTGKPVAVVFGDGSSRTGRNRAEKIVRALSGASA